MRLTDTKRVPETPWPIQQNISDILSKFSNRTSALRFGSYIEHRRTLATGQILQRDSLKCMQQLCGNLIPSRSYGTTRLPSIGHGTLQEHRVDSFYDLSQSDQRGTAPQQIPPRLAATTFDKSGAAQIIENLHKKVCRNRLPLRKLFQPGEGRPVMALRQLGHRPERVFQFL